MPDPAYARAWARYRRAEATTEARRAAAFASLLRASDAGTTHAEIGAELGVTRSRAGQLVQQARAARDREATT